MIAVSPKKRIEAQPRVNSKELGTPLLTGMEQLEYLLPVPQKLVKTLRLVHGPCLCLPSLCFSTHTSWTGNPIVKTY